jgi:hypothetical protein
MIDSTIVLASHFRIPEDDPYRLQRIDVLIKVPEGKKITIDEEAEDYLDYIRNDQNMSSSRMGGKTWRMNEDELFLLED